MSNKFSFSSTEDETLIGLVENNTVIFDSGHKKYKDIYFKDDIWKNISEVVGRSSIVLKKLKKSELVHGNHVRTRQRSQSNQWDKIIKSTASGR